jgi:hypothetical protein
VGVQSVAKLAGDASGNAERNIEATATGSRYNVTSITVAALLCPLGMLITILAEMRCNLHVHRVRPGHDTADMSSYSSCFGGSRFLRRFLCHNFRNNQPT